MQDPHRRFKDVGTDTGRKSSLVTMAKAAERSGHQPRTHAPHKRRLQACRHAWAWLTAASGAWVSRTVVGPAPALYGTSGLASLCARTMHGHKRPAFSLPSMLKAQAFADPFSLPIISFLQSRKKDFHDYQLADARTPRCCSLAVFAAPLKKCSSHGLSSER